MKEIIERVVNALSQKSPEVASEQERNVHDEISDFVAELLSKRADQLTRFGRTKSRASNFGSNSRSQR
ncbi:hypothetical protein V1291_000938 [Nitrobacteraceae bacterium AZCC 1564]